MIKLTNNSKRDFRLLNLTDPQLKIEEWNEDNITGKVFKKGESMATGFVASNRLMS